MHIMHIEGIRYDKVSQAIYMHIQKTVP